MTKKALKVFWIVFLLGYLTFLIDHAFSEISLLIFLGVGVAIFAHARKNLITLILLLGHMSIEWFEWGTQTLVLYIVLLNIIHTIMDFIFLHHEIKVHFKSSTYLNLFFVFIGLICIFTIAPSIKIEEEILESVHQFVLGGVIGCVGSHLIFHFTKEKQA